MNTSEMPTPRCASCHVPPAGPDLFAPHAEGLLPELLEAVQSRACLLPPAYRIVAAVMRECDRAGLLAPSFALHAEVTRDLN